MGECTEASAGLYGIDDVLRTLLETAADDLKNYVNAFFELIISRDLNLVEINISLILRA